MHHPPICQPIPPSAEAFPIPSLILSSRPSPTPLSLLPPDISHPLSSLSTPTKCLGARRLLFPHPVSLLHQVSGHHPSPPTLSTLPDVKGVTHPSLSSPPSLLPPGVEAAHAHPLLVVVLLEVLLQGVGDGQGADAVVAGVVADDGAADVLQAEGLRAVHRRGQQRLKEHAGVGVLGRENDAEEEKSNVSFIGHFFTCTRHKMYIDSLLITYNN